MTAIPRTFAALLLCLSSCGFLDQHTLEDPKFKAWMQHTIDDAASQAGQKVAQSLGITDPETLAIINEGIAKATGQVADDLKAALAKEGEAQRAAFQAIVQNLMKSAAAGAGASGNPLLMAIAALLAAGAGALGAEKLRAKKPEAPNV